MKPCFRILLGLALPAALALPAVAQEEGFPAKAPTTFEECATVPRDEERLACYDEIANSQFPDTMQKMREARERKKKKDFGLFLPGPGQELDELEITFVNVRKNPYGKVVLTTEDGQIWVQTDNKSLTYKQPIKGIIKKGLMGSYIFSPEGKERAIKVERIR
ncbi:MAG TPA: hypothetical protein VD713_03695 [Sphingomonadales bacterium]|nr:hypothetical protein [Sphingomonadales bacterium]